MKKTIRMKHSAMWLNVMYVYRLRTTYDKMRRAQNWQKWFLYIFTLNTQSYHHLHVIVVVCARVNI